MHRTESGKLAIELDEICKAFNGGRCEIRSNGPNGYSGDIPSDDDEFTLWDFWANYYINSEFLKSQGLDEFQDAYISVSLQASGDTSSRSGLEDMSIEFADEDDINNVIDRTGIVFVKSDEDGDYDIVDDWDVFEILKEKLSPRCSVNFEEEFAKIYNPSFLTEDPIWIAEHERFDNEFSQWLYTNGGTYHKTVIQTVLDRCKKEDEDLLPVSFKDYGLEFETDFGNEVTVAEYIIDNDIEVLRGYADDYLEEQAAKKKTKTRFR